MPAEEQESGLGGSKEVPAGEQEDGVGRSKGVPAGEQESGLGRNDGETAEELNEDDLFKVGKLSLLRLAVH